MLRIIGRLFDKVEVKQIGYVVCNDENGYIGFYDGKTTMNKIIAQRSCVGVGPRNAGTGWGKGEDPNFVVLDAVKEPVLPVYVYDSKKSEICFVKQTNTQIILLAAYKAKNGNFYAIVLNGRFFCISEDVMRCFKPLFNRLLINPFNFIPVDTQPYYTVCNLSEKPPVYTFNSEIAASNQNVISDYKQFVSHANETVIYKYTNNDNPIPTLQAISRILQNSTNAIPVSLSALFPSNEPSIQSVNNKEKVEPTCEAAKTEEYAVKEPEEPVVNIEIPKHLSFKHIPENIATCIKGLSKIKYSVEYVYVVSIFRSVYRNNRYSGLVAKEYLLWIRMYNPGLFQEVINLMNSTGILMFSRIISHLNDTVTKGYWYLEEEEGIPTELAVTIDYSKLLYITPELYRTDWKTASPEEKLSLVKPVIEARKAYADTFEKNAIIYPFVSTPKVNAIARTGRTTSYKSTIFENNESAVSIVPKFHTEEAKKYYYRICFAPSVLIMKPMEILAMEHRVFNKYGHCEEFEDVSDKLTEDYGYDLGFYFKENYVRYETYYPTEYDYETCGESYGSRMGYKYFYYIDEQLYEGDVGSDFYNVYKDIYQIYTFDLNVLDHFYEDSQKDKPISEIRDCDVSIGCVSLEGLESNFAASVYFDCLSPDERFASQFFIKDPGLLRNNNEWAEKTPIKMAMNFLTNENIYTPLVLFSLYAASFNEVNSMLMSALKQMSGYNCYLKWIEHSRKQMKFEDKFLLCVLIYPFSMYRKITTEGSRKDNPIPVYNTEDFVAGEGKEKLIALREEVPIQEEVNFEGKTPEKYFEDFYKKHMSTLSLVGKTFASYILYKNHIKCTCELLDKIIPLDANLVLANNIQLDCNDGHLTRDIEIMHSLTDDIKTSELKFKTFEDYVLAMAKQLQAVESSEESE